MQTKISKLSILGLILVLLGSQIYFRLKFLGFDFTVIIGLIIGLIAKKKIKNSSGLLIGLGIVNSAICIAIICITFTFVVKGLEWVTYDITRPIFESFLNKLYQNDYESAYELTSSEFWENITFDKFKDGTESIKRRLGRLKKINKYSFFINKRKLIFDNLNINHFYSTYLVEHDNKNILYVVDFEKIMGLWKISRLSYKEASENLVDSTIGIEWGVRYEN